MSIEQNLKRAAEFCERVDEWPDKPLTWDCLYQGGYQWVLDCGTDSPNDPHYVTPAPEKWTRFILEGWLREWLEEKRGCTLHCCQNPRVFLWTNAAGDRVASSRSYFSALLEAAEAVEQEREGTPQYPKAPKARPGHTNAGRKEKGE